MANDLDGFLAQHCSLTKRQIESLNLQISARRTLGRRDKEDRPHVISGVSEGSYYRVLGQARNNVEQAVYTMLLCSRMGLIQGGDLNRLLKMMGDAPSELPGGPDEVISLVEALVRKIVML